jgi:hypothetical protein
MKNDGRMAAVFVTGEDPPQASNRISLHPTEKDQSGLAIRQADHIADRMSRKEL